MDERRAGERLHVGGDDLGVIGHHRAVVMVIAQVLVEVIAHAGVKNRVHAFIQQRLHMAVHQLCRVAGGIGRNGGLPQVVQRLGGLGRNRHAEAQRGQKRVPEGQQLVEVQPHRQPDVLARALHAAVLGEQLALVVVKIVSLLRALGAQGLGALVAADELFAAGKGIDGQAAVVGTAVAGDGLHLMGKGFKLFGREQGAALRLLMRHGVERRAHRAHDAGERGADDVVANLLLEGAQHRVV